MENPNERTKGQIRPKAVWARCRFSQKKEWTNFFSHVCHEKQKSKQNKFICSFFGRIYGAAICLWFFLTFRSKNSKNQVSIETGLLIRTLQKWVKVFVDIVLSSLISFSQVGVDHQTISLLWSARAAGKKCHTGCGVGIIYTLKIIC